MIWLLRTNAITVSNITSDPQNISPIDLKFPAKKFYHDTAQPRTVNHDSYRLYHTRIIKKINSYTYKAVGLSSQTKNNIFRVLNGRKPFANKLNFGFKITNSESKLCCFFIASFFGRCSTVMLIN
jgi:hypothetical protein